MTVVLKMAAVGVMTMTFFGALLMAGATSAAVAVYLVGIVLMLTWPGRRRRR